MIRMSREVELEKIEEFVRNHDVRKCQTAFVSPSIQAINIFGREFSHSDVKLKKRFYMRNKKKK